MTFFNQPVGKQMKKAFLFAGFLCILQLICLFLPFGEYHASVAGWDKLSEGGDGLFLEYCNGFFAFLGAVDIFMLIVAAILCFAARSDKKMGRGKRFFLRLVVILYMICLIAAIVRVETLAFSVKYEIEQQFGSDSGNLVEASAQLLFGAWLAILISVLQLLVMFFATIKSKANDIVLDNSPEAMVAKYGKLLKEGILTQEEYEEKVKQALAFKETEHTDGSEAGRSSQDIG